MHTEDYMDGFCARCGEYGLDPEALVKAAQDWGDEFVEGLQDRVGMENPIARGVTGFGAYMLPGVGTAISGANALGNFREAFRNDGKTWREWGGLMGKGLANTAWAGASIIPGVGAGGAVGRGLMKGMSSLGKAVKPLQGVTRGINKGLGLAFKLKGGRPRPLYGPGGTGFAPKAGLLPWQKNLAAYTQKNPSIVNKALNYVGQHPVGATETAAGVGLVGAGLAQSSGENARMQRLAANDYSQRPGGMTLKGDKGAIGSNTMEIR